MDGEFDMAVPNLWRTKKQRYRLQAEICPTCAEAIFPPREICPQCHQPMQQEMAATLAFLLPVQLELAQTATPVAIGAD